MAPTVAPARWVPPLVAGVVLVGLAAVLGAVILELGNGPFLIDAWWNALLAGMTSPVLLGFAWTMNALGGGWFATYVVPLGVAVVFVVVRRPWAAAYFLVASAASAGVVQVLKHLYGRARPEDIIVVSDFGSFPSGHTSNAATVGVALFVMFPRLWIGLAGIAWTLLMAFSRTYLHAHWLSDTLGGALAGAGATLIVTAVFAALFAREAAHRRVHTLALAPVGSSSGSSVAGLGGSRRSVGSNDRAPTSSGGDGGAEVPPSAPDETRMPREGAG